MPAPSGLFYPETIAKAFSASVLYSTPGTAGFSLSFSAKSNKSSMLNKVSFQYALYFISLILGDRNIGSVRMRLIIIKNSASNFFPGAGLTKQDGIDSP